MLLPPALVTAPLARCYGPLALAAALAPCSASLTRPAPRRYADLKGNRNGNYIFDYDRMLDPRGNTAVYMLYTGARLCSILRKAGAEIGSAPAQALLAQTTLTLDHPAELAVASVLIRFQAA